MSNEEKVRRTIKQIAARKQNVTLDEIDWVMNQIAKHGCLVVVENDHQRIYSLDGVRFGVCTHHSGRKQIKAIYVKAFISAMRDLGWYEED